MRGRESEAGSAQTTLTLIQLTRTSRHHPPPSPQKVLWRRGNGEAVGVETLEAVVGNLHIRRLIAKWSFLTDRSKQWGRQQRGRPSSPL